MMLNVMFDPAARDFLQQPLIARLSTHLPSGYPHTVPVWFMLDGGDIVFISERDTRKVKNVVLNPKGSLSVGGDVGEAAYLITGDLRVEEDPGFAWMKRLTYHYETPEKAEADIEAWSKNDMIILRMTVVNVLKVV